MRPPPLSLTYESLPDDEDERHEALANVFGELAVWARNASLDRSRRLVNDGDARSELGTIHQEPYAAIASHSEDVKNASLDLAEVTLDTFARLLLTCISGQGSDAAIGPDHIVWFRLDLEVRDRATEELVYSETINRDGRRFFPEYWFRWLNRFGRRSR